MQIREYINTQYVERVHEMKREDVVIGMKVKVKSKSAGKPLSESTVYAGMKERNQDFLYVAHQHAIEVGVSDRFLLTDDKSDIHCCGDYFLCSDFEPYVEE